MLNFFSSYLELQEEKYRIEFPKVNVDQTGNIRVSDVMKRAQMGMPIIGDPDMQYDCDMNDPRRNEDNFEHNPLNVIGGLDLDDMLHLAHRYSDGYVDGLKNKQGELDKQITAVKAHIKNEQTKQTAQAVAAMQPTPTS